MVLSSSSRVRCNGPRGRGLPTREEGVLALRGHLQKGEGGRIIPVLLYCGIFDACLSCENAWRGALAGYIR